MTSLDFSAFLDATYDKYEIVSTTIRPSRERRRMKHWRLATTKPPTRRRRRLCERTGHPPTRVEAFGYSCDSSGSGIVSHCRCQRCGAMVA